VSASPCRDTGPVEREAVEAAAQVLYIAWWEHRTVVEGKSLPTWTELCEEKRDRFRAQARVARTFMRIDIR